MAQPTPTSRQPELRTHSRSRDHQIHGDRGWKRRYCQTWPGELPSPLTSNITLPKGTQSLAERKQVSKTPDFEEPPDLGLEVVCFLRGLAKSSEEEEKAPSPKPPLKELHKWVAWKDEACQTPGWWRELLASTRGARLQRVSTKGAGLVSSPQKGK